MSKAMEESSKLTQWMQGPLPLGIGEDGRKMRCFETSRTCENEMDLLLALLTLRIAATTTSDQGLEALNMWV